MKRILRITAIPLAVILVSALVRVALYSDDREAAPAVRIGATSALTLIIDPGHGGMDGGAVSIHGVRESEINLDVAQRLELIMGFFGVHTVTTRDSEELDYSKDATTIRAKKNEDIRNRINLINSTENAVLISIHQNKYHEPGPSGAQVLYARTAGSREFADGMQAALTSALNPRRARKATVVPKGVYIMNNITPLAILIECGFLSNPDESSLLTSSEYRLKIAMAIAAGFLNNRDILETVVMGS